LLCLPPTNTRQKVNFGIEMEAKKYEQKK